jgi:putative RNA 2'-phosphotransferase
MNLTELSKKISYILRHAPFEYELELDENGWVEIDHLIEALRTEKKWIDITINDLYKMIDISDKKRHEISNGKIKALYGHTLPNKIKIEEKEPPEILYHGTARRFIEKIKQEGLLPMNRQYVHLSIDKETALIVGKRRDEKPFLLTINSKLAFKNGIKFYKGNDKIWLADCINNKYIQFE